MRIRSPSLSELHAFATAARLGSFSQAADELHVTQGAISRSIARLEEHLALALFVREGRRSVLTATGQSYLDAIAPAIASIEAATVALQTRRTARALRLSVAPTLFSHWLIPRLPDFHARHPDTTLSFAPYRRDDPLQAPEIDAWLRVGAREWPRHIQAEYVVGRELVPICRPADLHGPHAIRTAHDLIARPLLFHTNYPDNWARWFAGVGCAHAPLAPAADFELVGLLVQAVIAGLGVAVVQRCLVEPDLAAGRIAIAVPQAVEIDRGYYLCQPPGRVAPAALHDFRQWLLSQPQHATP
ncbi:LysR family transcriptional regulator [Acidovorax sp. SRB_14]|uniref:LysR substrate-binding domain-containing protein n=1 Tax=unclassified Acidovorax TaxID=2684926 RepID=UPI00145CEFF6|nr:MULTISPECIES: LysR substrate-binding domain-containing protein [unclassified Acidovorax]NMM75626.1 LysR family transcriptional regulator [Acidovorax sp. SRB_24]NMM76854.1 LysR family transcriptional regulator [Acidovorax sp. SRB_24]NMM80037.1 LysR family transcriptional regulator [Acidovorax sp. SRB_14]NMM86224.1 LysR family transcriptional regulator [Rhodococcus sp. SRB_17]